TIFHTLGISITPALTALGVGGLAVALALQDTLSNLFAGLQILASRQITPGDFVRLSSGEEGYVADITWRNTTLQTTANSLVIVPNNKISTNIVTNLDLPSGGIRVLFSVMIGAEVDLEKLEPLILQISEQVMKETQVGAENFTPEIRYSGFSYGVLNLTVALRARNYAGCAKLQTEWIRKTIDAFKKENIPLKNIQPK